MPVIHRTITDEQWDRAADSFELGLQHATDIARHLGVSPATVSREMKRRGCIKGKSAKLTIRDLELFLARKARRRVMSRREELEKAKQARALTDALIDKMMGAIIAADKAGDISQAASTIDKVRKALT